jgi:hypothetical protein
MSQDFFVPFTVALNSLHSQVSAQVISRSDETLFIALSVEGKACPNCGKTSLVKLP